MLSNGQTEARKLLTIRKRVDAGSPPATINRETQLLGQAYSRCKASHRA